MAFPMLEHRSTS